VVDDVRIHDRALTAAELAGPAPVPGALLALDFDSVTERGSYLSYGSSLSGVDGLIGSDRKPQPETTQLAWAHQPLRFAYADGVLSVTNERQFSDTGDVDLRWRVTEGSKTIKSGEQPLRVAAATTGRIPLPVKAGDRERFLTVEAVVKAPRPMLPAGHVLAHDQFSLGGTRVPGLDQAPLDWGLVTTRETADAVTAQAGPVGYRVDKRTGTLSSMQSWGQELLASGPKLDALVASARAGNGKA